MTAETLEPFDFPPRPRRLALVLKGDNRPGARTNYFDCQIKPSSRSAAVRRYAALIAAGRRIFEPGRYRSRASK